MLIVFVCSVHHSLPHCRRLANISRLPRRLSAPIITCAKLLRFSRLANGLLRVLQRPVISQHWDRVLSRSSKLDALAITDDVIRGQYLRASIFGDARNEMLQKIDAVPALAARFRIDSALFSDYASALYACIPVGAKAAFIYQACSIRRGSRERLFDTLHHFDAFCTILVRSAFPSLTICNFGSFTATCHSRSGGC